MIGTVVAGRYQLDAMIGSGGTGTVFRALDRRLQRPIAIKLQHRGGEVALARLQREARIAALVQTSGMLRILDVGQDGELAYLVMELLAGETLHARAARRPPDLVRALGWTASCAKTMAAVHAHGIVHRDLKPDNLFLDAQAGAEVLVVLDFGLAFATEHEDPALGRLSDPD